MLIKIAIVGMGQDSCFSTSVVVGRNDIIRHLYEVVNDREQQSLLTAVVAIKRTIVLLICDLVDGTRR